VRPSETAFGTLPTGSITAIMGGSIRVIIDTFTDYMMASAIAIQKHWKFDSSGPGKDLESIILIQILSDGTIDKVHFDTKSGDERFDASIRHAVQASNPLSPFTNMGDTKCITLGLRFSTP
jgi:hypothetical protein